MLRSTYFLAFVANILLIASASASAQPKCLRPNEVYIKCIDGCNPNTCESIDRIYHCPLQRANKTCTGGCGCKQGYYRNKINQCISEENCKKCAGPNEYYSCGGACDNVCATLAVRNQTSCDIVNVKCNEMCYCEDGYARNENGTCVPFNLCPEQTKCGKNEVLTPCLILYCEPETCEQKETKPFCPHISPGIPCHQPGCVCKRGYLRGPNGSCIPEAQCPPKCGKLEVPNSCINGGCYKARTCLDIRRNSTICVDPIKCNPGCLCKEGYLRDKSGKCIPENQCPEKKCTGPNEYYSCGGACDNVCATLAVRNQTSCDIVNKKCNDMCYCDEGFARNANGTCVPFNQCPKLEPKCLRPNEVYIKCIDGCNPNTCESIDRIYHCPLQRANKTCTGGCGCKQGYYRNKINQCISEENCKKCAGPNEYYSCGGACDNVCATLAVRNQTSCDIVNVKCNEMCYCEDGYARNENGTCVPFNLCPEQTKCGKNEVLTPCLILYCEPKTCEQKGTKPFCPHISPGIPCHQPGCVCKRGYLRGPNGSCIPEAQSRRCGANEIYSNCTNGGCFGARTCEEVGNVDIKCVKMNPKNCIKGCKCSDGYVKSNNGTCILEHQCPKQYHESCANDSKEKSSSGDKNGSEEEKYSESGSEEETYSYSENASSGGEGEKYDDCDKNNHEKKNTNDYNKNGNNNSTDDCSQIQFSEET